MSDEVEKALAESRRLDYEYLEQQIATARYFNSLDLDFVELQGREHTVGNLAENTVWESVMNGRAMVRHITQKLGVEVSRNNLIEVFIKKATEQTEFWRVEMRPYKDGGYENFSRVVVTINLPEAPYDRIYQRLDLGELKQLQIDCTVQFHWDLKKSQLPSVWLPKEMEYEDACRKGSVRSLEFETPFTTFVMNNNEG